MPNSSSFIVTTPAAEPIANATSTNANQPRTAAVRWPALHRAARAVRLSAPAIAAVNGAMTVFARCGS